MTITNKPSYLSVEQQIRVMKRLKALRGKRKQTDASTRVENLVKLLKKK